MLWICATRPFTGTSMRLSNRVFGAPSGGSVAGLNGPNPVTTGLSAGTLPGNDVFWGMATTSWPACPSYNVLNAQALPIWLRGDINGLVSICSGVGKLMLSGSGRPAGFFSVNCPPHGWVGSCWTPQNSVLPGVPFCVRSGYMAWVRFPILLYRTGSDAVKSGCGTPLTSFWVLH